MWDKIINVITKANDWLNGIVWGWPMIILILGTGIYLTIRTRALQVRRFGTSWGETIIPTVKRIGKRDKKKSKKEKEGRLKDTGDITH